MFKKYKALVEKVEKIYDEIFYSYMYFGIGGNEPGNRIRDLKDEIKELEKSMRILKKYLKVEEVNIENPVIRKMSAKRLKELQEYED